MTLKAFVVEDKVSIRESLIEALRDPTGIDTTGVLRSCRDREPGRKPLVWTATANPDVRRHCEQLGCDGVFDKSMETDALMDYCLGLVRTARQ